MDFLCERCIVNENYTIKNYGGIRSAADLINFVSLLNGKFDNMGSI